MARSSECTEQYAQKVFDSAGIVRDAMFRQLAVCFTLRCESGYYSSPRKWIPCQIQFPRPTILILFRLGENGVSFRPSCQQPFRAQGNWS